MPHAQVRDAHRWILAALAVYAALSGSAEAANQTTTTTSTTQAVDYNKVTCFSDAGCMMPIRGPPYCSGDVVERELRYGECENPGTEDSRCVQRRNTTMITECDSEHRCVNGVCVRQATEEQTPPDTRQTETTTTTQETTTTTEAMRQEAGAETTTTAPNQPMPSAANQTADQTQQTQPAQAQPNMAWIPIILILALLAAAAAVTATLIGYLIYKKRKGGGGSNGKTSIVAPRGRSSSLNVRYTR